MDSYTENSHTLNSSSPMWESIDPFMSINTTLVQNQNCMDFDNMNVMMDFSNNDHSHHTNQINQLDAKMFHDQLTIPVVSFQHEQSGNKKRKVGSMEKSSLSLVHSPTNDEATSNHEICRGKRAKISEKKTEKIHAEVVHVRAKRGQATDSHSVAERVRRGKINERLQCLQDIVPGCYKTMGMAVMLDEIINYVQSLQNQVEFLSMKLTAAAQFHEFNAHTEAVAKMQKTIMGHNHNEARDWEKIIGKDHQEMANFFQGTWPF